MKKIVIALLIAVLASNAMAKKRTQTIKSKYIKDFVQLRDLTKKNKHVSVLRLVEKIEKNVDLNNLEKAYLCNFKGGAFYEAARYKDSLQEYKNSISFEEGLPEKNRTQIQENVIPELQKLIDKNEKRLISLKQKITEITDDKKKAEAYFELAKINYRLSNQDDIEKNVETALSIYNSLGLKPQVFWLDFKFSYLREQERYSEMLPIAEQIIELEPEKNSRKILLASVHHMIGNVTEKIEIYESLYNQGLLDKEPQLVDLGWFYYENQKYQKAIELYENGFDKNTIKKTENSMLVLKNSYYRSGMIDESISIAEEAYSLFKSRKWILWLDKVQYEKQNWAEVEKINEKLIYIHPQSKSLAWLRIGEARYHLGDKKGAERAFKTVRKISKKRKEKANEWLKKLKKR